MPTLKKLERKLRKSSHLLDQCACMIRDIPLHPTKGNIRRIGIALGEIFEIKNQIYSIDKNLMPKYLKSKLKHPKANRELNDTYRIAINLEDSKDIQGAIRAFEDFIKQNQPKHYRKIAQSEICRLMQINVT